MRVPNSVVSSLDCWLLPAILDLSLAPRSWGQSLPMPLVMLPPPLLKQSHPGCVWPSRSLRSCLPWPFCWHLPPCVAAMPHERSLERSPMRNETNQGFERPRLVAEVREVDLISPHIKE